MKPDVVICECFARDGLQHETLEIQTSEKVTLIDTMTDIGFSRIEATSYSNPKRVPVFADCSVVLKDINRGRGVWYKATCPNGRAVERALIDLDAGYGANEISFLASTTESHSQRNLLASRDEQWIRIEEMAKLAAGRFRTVGVISVALGCPFEGAVDPAVVAEDVARFASLGVSLVTIGDTVGTATPRKVKSLFNRLLREIPDVIPVAHFHDTRGTAIANNLAALESGCTHFDAALGGVGGHPAKIQYGSGQAGNVSTEDLVSVFDAEGLNTGLNFDKLMQLSQRCEAVLGRPLYSKVARAGLLAAQTQNS